MKKNRLAKPSTFGKRLPVPVAKTPAAVEKAADTTSSDDGAPESTLRDLTTATDDAVPGNTFSTTTMDNEQNFNHEDSGFLEPVIKRDYAENPAATLQPEPAPAPAPEPAPAPNKSFFGIPRIKAPEPVEPPADQLPPEPAIPTMQYQEPVIDTSDNADSLGRQAGEHVGHTTSEWAFGILENFYPEVVHYFTKVDGTFVEKAKLPLNVEIELIQKIMDKNKTLKGKVQISEFHKKNILPPLQRILAKKGWENVIPDEVMLIAGLVMLAADTFFKITAIRKENSLLMKDIRKTLNEHLGVMNEHQAETRELKAQVASMSAIINRLAPQDAISAVA